MQLTKNVFVNTGLRGANVGYVTTSHGIVMIESPQMPTEAVTWRKEIEEKGKIVYLINTEPHGDHVTGDFFFEAPVIAHEKTREAVLAMDKGPPLAQRLAQMDPASAPLLAGYRIRMPTITFDRRLSLHLGSHTFDLMHMPGHTQGQTAVLVPEERLVFTGDNVVFRTQAFLYDSDPLAWLDSLQKIGELDVDRIIPGHGEVCGKSYVSEQASFIRDWIDAVKNAIRQGWTKEQAVSRISFLDRYPMGPGMEQMGPDLQKRNVARLWDVLPGP